LDQEVSHNGVCGLEGRRILIFIIKLFYFFAYWV
jgi:hypothetical protein